MVKCHVVQFSKNALILKGSWIRWGHCTIKTSCKFQSSKPHC